jgi:hypothetical protein
VADQGHGFVTVLLFDFVVFEPLWLTLAISTDVRNVPAAHAVCTPWVREASLAEFVVCAPTPWKDAVDTVTQSVAEARFCNVTVIHTLSAPGRSHTKRPSATRFVLLLAGVRANAEQATALVDTVLVVLVAEVEPRGVWVTSTAARMIRNP